MFYIKDDIQHYYDVVCLTSSCRYINNRKFLRFTLPIYTDDIIKMIEPLIDNIFGEFG